MQNKQIFQAKLRIQHANCRVFATKCPDKIKYDNE